MKPNNQNDYLRNTLRTLIELQIEIDSKGGPEKNDKLFEEYFHVRAKILERFGLPDTDNNGKLFFVEKLPTDSELEAMIKRLHQAATDYILSPTRTEAQILQEAVDLQLEPEKVLPELGITPHVYTIFIYKEILLAKRDSPISVLKALRLADEPKTLNLLGIVALCKEFGEEEKTMLQYLSAKGIKYLDNYLSAFQLEGKDKEIGQSQLAEFWHDLNGGFEFKTLNDKFEALTHYLLNYLCLVVGNKPYRIIELEIYYYHEKEHKDPYCHKDKEQLNAGTWYFNGYGLDITFGNRENEIYGGILIRGIRSLDKVPRYFSGPSNVLKEIFSNLGNIVNGQHSICLRELNKGVVEEVEPIQSVRIGLTKTKEDTDNFAERKYRYLVDLNLQHKFKDKEKVIKQLLTSKKLTKAQAKKIMNYDIKL